MGLASSTIDSRVRDDGNLAGYNILLMAPKVLAD